MKIGDMRRTIQPISLLGVAKNVRGWLDIGPLKLPTGSFLKIASEPSDRLCGGLRVNVTILKLGATVPLLDERNISPCALDVSASAAELSALTEPV